MGLEDKLGIRIILFLRLQRLLSVMWLSEAQCWSSYVGVGVGVVVYAEDLTK